MTNRVEDGEPNPKNTKGVRDARVHDMAASVAKDTNEAKKAAANTQDKKSTTYGRAALMPSQILELLPYKETHEALKNSDYDALHQLLNRFVQQIAIEIWEKTWDSLDKAEKKLHLKALVYLDTLISLYRMPPSFELVLSELSQRFRGVQEQPLEMILNKFCTMGIQEQGDDRRKSKSVSKLSNSEVQYKLMKSKE